MELNLLQEYKELYYKEIEFKDSMSNKIGTSITFLTILCTGHMYMWNIMIKLDFIIHIVPILFVIIELVSVYYTGRSIYNFYKSYHKYTYYLISIEDIKKQLDNNNSLCDSYTQSEIDNANYEMMCNTFLKYAIINRDENIRKNKHQNNLTDSLVRALISLISSYIVWFFVISQIKF